MIERRFALTVDDSTAREVVQVQFIGWPDHGIPDSHGHMVDVLERANLAQKAFIAAEGRSSAGPMVVHCSAGCGRTGTIIALDTFLRLMDLDLALAAKRDPDVLTESPSLSDKVDWNKDWIFEIVKQLRTQRTTMVQAFDQYRFLYLEIMARLGAE